MGVSADEARRLGAELGMRHPQSADGLKEAVGGHATCRQQRVWCLFGGASSEVRRCKRSVVV